MVDVWVKRWNKLKHLFDKKENYYKALALILVIIYGFLFLSRLLIHTPSDYENTPLRKHITTGNLVTQMTSKTFYTDRNLLQIGLIIDDQSVNVPKGFTVKVREKSNTKTKYKTQLLKVTDDYYLLFVHNLSPNWQSVSIQISEKGESKIALSDDQKIYTSNPATVQSKHFKTQVMDYYANQYYELLIQDNLKNERRELKKQKAYQSDIKDVNEKIKSLKDELSYQTGSKKLDTQNDIMNEQSQIDSIKNNIKSSQQRYRESQEEISLLKKKKGKLDY